MVEQYKIDDMMTNLQSYLESNGINTSRMFTCINPEHIDRNPSMRFYGNDNKVYCFGCGAHYDLVDCISIFEHLDRRKAFKKAIDTYCLNLDNKSIKQPPKAPKIQQEVRNKDYTKAYSVWHSNFEHNENAKNYFLSRGLDLEIANRFNIGYNEFNYKDFKFSGLIIPISKNCFNARNLDQDNTQKYFKPKGCKAEIFNKTAIQNDIPYCVITEGEFDCLSFEAVGVNACALSSACNTELFIEMQKPLKTYILAFDNDNGGELATQKLEDYLNENNIPYMIFDNCEYKDANEALVKDRDNFEKEIKCLCKEIMNKEKRKQKLHNAEM